ncbi:MAG: PEP-CTERM sorting domain-containing protein [Acidobacteria bacterium]|nr:PEP-CTERM sorting domain-containing protein [Acidobacteriota bacterium]
MISIARKLALLGMFCASEAAAVTVFLDFEDGLLPTAHGWSFEGTDEGLLYSIAGGVLRGDTFSLPGEGGGYYKLPGVYDASKDTVFELRARYIDGSGGLGSAFGVYGPSSYVEIGVQAGQLQIVSEPMPPGSTTVGAATMGGFHTFTLLLPGGTQTMEVKVDGVTVFQGTRRLGVVPNGIGFGDFTAGGDGTWEVDSLFYSNDVPEPATLGIVLIGLCGLSWRMRRLQ